MKYSVNAVDIEYYLPLAISEMVTIIPSYQSIEFFINNKEYFAILKEDLEKLTNGGKLIHHEVFAEEQYHADYWPLSMVLL